MPVYMRENQNTMKRHIKIFEGFACMPEKCKDISAVHSRPILLSK